MRVLVVEDDPVIASGLQLHLARRGYVVDCVGSIAQAWQAMLTSDWDLVLLDLGLPDGDGTGLLRRIRSTPAARLPRADVPVLVMTARDEVGQRVAGLDEGADDYMGKPFDIGELDARMRALLRRAGGRSSPKLVHGSLELDPSSRTATLAGRPVPLSAREFAVLQLLVEARGRPLLREQMEERLYSWDDPVGSNAVEVHVHHVRRKLGPQWVQTRRGLGYSIAVPPPDTPANGA